MSNVLAPKVSTTQSGANGGWLSQAFNVMGANRLHCLSLVHGNELTVQQLYPLRTVYPNKQALVTACRIAVAGEARKDSQTQVTPAGPADNVLNLLYKSFGARIKVSDSLTNLKFGSFDIKIGDGATVLSEVFVDVAVLPVRIVMLGIAINRGQATVIPIAAPRITVVAASSSTAVTVYLTAETLNEADLGGV